MGTLPLKVKRRNQLGAIAEVQCDSIAGAIAATEQFREFGHTEIWIEDANGRRVEEKTLHALK